MKKSYLMMAAAATMFAACTQSDFVNDIPESTPQAIGFETVTSKTTRAENSNAEYTWDLGNHHLAFTVWGHKLVGTDGIEVFSGTDGRGVKVSKSGDKWSYEDTENGVNLVYWDKGASKYDFYAVAPVMDNFWTLNNNSTVNETSDDYIITSEYEVVAHNAATYLEATETNTTKSFKDVTIAKDLMIAAPATISTDGFDKPVQLNFIHILSRLNVTVNTNLEGVVVKNITVGNLSSKGTFNETGKFDEDDTAIDATTLKNGTYSRWNLTSGVVAYTNTKEQALTKDKALIAIEALVMPQLAGVEPIVLSETNFTNKKPYLFVEYTINGQAYRRAYNLADTFNGTESNDLAFNEGWQYTLSLSIGATAISFTPNVAVWADGTPAGNQNIN